MSYACTSLIQRDEHTIITKSQPSLHFRQERDEKHSKPSKSAARAAATRGMPTGTATATPLVLVSQSSKAASRYSAASKASIAATNGGMPNDYLVCV